ncbi:MAG: polyprenol monophosphomannose synthase [Anaerolineae bacterium]|jgi:dolichol-phosphate mannosyltransferase|nr:polyprenol monophosphomannose synthase [Anaerolineae bacterium]
MAVPRLMVVLPTYNEKDNLPLITRALFDLKLPGLEILVVDDGSPDGTGQLAEALRVEYDAKLHVLHRQEKNGLGPAYLAGFQQAIALGAEWIVQMDADGSHQPKYLHTMLEMIQRYDVVVGSRFMRGGGVDTSWSLYRKFLSLWANRIYTPSILHLPVYDATGGFKIWRREVLLGMDLRRIQSNGYVFQVEMTYVAHRLGYRIGEFPIYFPDRTLGESKMSSRVALEAALRVWQILFRHRHLRPSMRQPGPAAPAP